MPDGDLQKAGEALKAAPVIAEVNGLREEARVALNALTNVASKYLAIKTDPKKVQGPADRAFADASFQEAAAALVAVLDDVAPEVRAIFDAMLAAMGYSKA